METHRRWHSKEAGLATAFIVLPGGGEAGARTNAVLTMRAELIGHFEACMTEIYLHIVARMAKILPLRLSPVPSVRNGRCVPLPPTPQRVDRDCDERAGSGGDTRRTQVKLQTEKRPAQCEDASVS